MLMRSRRLGQPPPPRPAHPRSPPPPLMSEPRGSGPRGAQGGARPPGPGPRTLTIGSHNTGRGLLQQRAVGAHRFPGQSKFLALLSHWFVEQRLDIVCLQELWLRHNAVEGLEQLLASAAGAVGCQIQGFWAPSRGDASAGVAVLVRKALVDKGHLAISAVSRALHGRLIHMRCTWGGHSFRLINVYLPSGDPLAQRALLQGQVAPLLRRYGTNTILCGDFNFTMDWVVDRTHRPILQIAVQLPPSLPEDTAKPPRRSGRQRRPPPHHAQFTSNFGGEEGRGLLCTFTPALVVPPPPPLVHRSPAALCQDRTRTRLALHPCHLD